MTATTKRANYFTKKLGRLTSWQSLQPMRVRITAAHDERDYALRDRLCQLHDAAAMKILATPVVVLEP